MKQQLLIVLGGRSAEHEISILSARNIVAAVDRTRFDIILVGIARNGTWYHLPDTNFLINNDYIANNLREENIATLIRLPDSVQLLTLGGYRQSIDVAFPVLHGPYGEDGTIQGWFDMMNLPYVGCGTLASALAMDKAIFKQVLRDAGIPIAPFLILDRTQGAITTYEKCVAQLGSNILFVKPTCLGSSIGISKVTQLTEYTAALALAFEYGDTVIIEKCIHGREIETAVLGSTQLKVAGAGEIIPLPHHEFYSYEAKYFDPNGAELKIPADLSTQVLERLKALSIQVFKLIGGTGMARVDFFVTEDQNIFVNELNSIPGFTEISMYPKLWHKAGLSATELVTTLIDHGFDVHQRRQRIALMPTGESDQKN